MKPKVCPKNAGTKQELQEAFGKWIEQKGDWKWYATLTFSDRSFERVAKKYPGWDKISWHYARRAWDNWITMLGEVKGLHDIPWVRVGELQNWRGVPHWHALLARCEGLDRTQAWRWWFDNYGFARVERYEEKLGANFYLGKYLVKDDFDIDFGGIV